MVTGANGFLGTALVRKLKEIGGMDLILPSHKEYDLTNQEQTNKLFEQAGPEIVFNLAVYFGGINTNLEKPADIFYKNIMIGTNVVEACRKYSVDKLIYTGSSCSYADNSQLPFSEERLYEDGLPAKTNLFYGWTKKTVGLMLDSYKRQYGLKSVYLILTNLYGV